MINQKTEYKILKNMLSFAKELANCNEHMLWELGHYLADNIISKLALSVTMEKLQQGYSINYKNNNGFVKNFKWMYENVLEQFYTVPKYNDLVKKFHRDRNIYQHRYDSISLGIRKEFAIAYVQIVEDIMKEIGIVKGKIPASAFISRKSASKKSFAQEEGVSYKKMEDFYINGLIKKGQKILNKLLEEEPSNPKLKVFLAINDFVEITKAKTEAKAIEALNSFSQNLESYRKYLEILRSEGKKENIKDGFLKFFKFLNDKFIWSEDIFKKSKIALNYFLYLFITYYKELEPIRLLEFIQEIRKFRLERFSLMILDYFTGLYYLLREDYSNAEKFFINQVTRFTNFQGHEPYLEIAFKIEEFNFMDIGINTLIYLLILVILQNKDTNLKKIIIIKNGIEGSNYKRYNNYSSQFKKEFIVQKELIIEQLKYFRDNFDLFRVRLDKVNEQLDRIYEKEFKEETFNMVDIEDLTDLEED